MSSRPHIALAEKHIRPLRPGEVVHHKDFDHYNNDLDNLEILTKAEHIRIHKPVLGYKFTDEQRRRLSEAHLGQEPWNKGLKGQQIPWNKGLKGFQAGRKITWGDKITAAKTKVHLEDVLAILRQEPDIKLEALKQRLDIKTSGPILKFGGLRRLRQAVQI